MFAARGHFLGVVTAIGIAAMAPAAAQDQAPTFRTGVGLVSVDIYPRRDGRVVEGLQRGDFQVLEDGTLQEISSFELVRHVAAADADIRDPSTVADSRRQAADPRNRLFVIYLDQQHGTVSGWTQARQPITRFLRDTIGASDLFAVAGPDTPVSRLTFARRTETLESELARSWDWEAARQSPRTAEETRLAVCAAELFGHSDPMALVRRLREDVMFTNLENLIASLGALREERKNLMFLSEPWTPEPERPELATVRPGITAGAIPGIGTSPGGRLGMGNTSERVDQAWCESLVRRLVQIDFGQRFRDVLESAKRANVSFFPVDIGGLRTSRSAAGEIFRSMADDTDGLAVTNTNDLSGAMQRIAASLASYYRVTYYSTNTATDGRFRRIDVRVRASDVKVAARRGYYAAAAAPPARVAAAAAAPADTARDAARAMSARFRSDTALFTAGSVTPSALHVTVELARGESQKPAWSKGAAVAVKITSADGAEHAASGAIAPLVRGTVVAIPRAPADDGPWRISVVASAPGVSLDDRFDVSAASAAPPRPLATPLAFRALPSPRSVPQPAADVEWSRRERLHLEWPLLSAVADPEVHVLDRLGNVLPLAPALTAITTPDGEQRLVADLVLSPLAPGEYFIELAATIGGRAERSVALFRVIP